MPIDEPRPVPATGVPTTLALIAAIAVGALLRTLVADQPLFADELSTTWIVTAHGLGGVLSTVHSNAEITPPLTFVASWFAAQLSTAPEVLRSPALISGVALIPLVYAIGLRTVGRAAALVAALLTAVSPFMVYYSTEARAYGLMMALVAVSTLALLLAVDHGRRRWWVLYAAASAGAAYSHYTCVFLLAVQFAWVLWAHPGARRAAVLANVGAALAFLPWITGLRNDLNSPPRTSSPRSRPSPSMTFGPRWSTGWRATPTPICHCVRCPVTSRWCSSARGWPARQWRWSPASGAGSRAACWGTGASCWCSRWQWPFPLGTFVRQPGGHQPLHHAQPRCKLAGVRPVAGCAAGRGRPAGAVCDRGTGHRGPGDRRGPHARRPNQRPDYRAAAAFVDRQAAAGDVVVDATGSVSPGPLTPLDVTLDPVHPVVRAGHPPSTTTHSTWATAPSRSRRRSPRQPAAARRRVYLVAALPPICPPTNSGARTWASPASRTATG